MRVDPDYRDFLTSGKPLDYLVEKIADVDKFRAIPAVAKLLTISADLERRGETAAIDDAIVEFLDSDMGFVLESVRDWISSTARDHRRLPPFKDAIEFDDGLFRNLNLTKKDGVSITLSSIAEVDLRASTARGEGSRVVFSGQQVFFKFLLGQDVPLTIWECDRYGDHSEFGELTCRAARTVIVSAGDVLAVDGTFQSLSFGSCDATVVFLQVENLMRDVGTSVAFRRDTGRFLATFPTDRTALRRMAMCSALKHMGQQHRLADLPATARDGPFYLRWHFIRETVAAAPSTSLGLLSSVAEQDPSPTVRRAAQATLSILQNRGQQNGS